MQELSVDTMSKIKDVFVSYSHQDRELAEKLVRELNAHQISTFCAAESLEPGVNWQREIEQAIKTADAVVVLVSARHDPDPHQQFEWSTALETEWENPGKRLIPLLLRDAELPSFLSNRQALRIIDPRKDWKQAIEALLHALRDEPPEAEKLVSTDKEALSKRRDRLRYIEEMAHTLKTH